MKNKLLLIAIWASLTNAWAQTDSSRVFASFDKVAKNEVEFKPNYTIYGLDPFINECKNARVVYTGESHNYVEFNNIFSFVVLKELNQKFHFTEHIIELGPARAAHINKFLQGDSLSEAVLKATTSYSHFEFYTLLKKYNDTLPMDKKITVHGIDVERFNDIALINIALLLQKQASQPPSEIYTLVQKLIFEGNALLENGLLYYNKKAIEYSNMYDLNSYKVKKMLTNIDSLKNQLKNYLGSDYAILVQNIDYLTQYVTYKQYNGTPFEHNWRETNMYQNLQKLVNEKPNAKFYGQFGRCHSMLTTNDREVCGWYNFRSTIERIKTNNPSIITKTLGIFYGSNDYTDDHVYKPLFKQAYPNKITLFQLNTNESYTQLGTEYDFAINTQKLLTNTQKNIKSKSSYNALGIIMGPNLKLRYTQQLHNLMQNSSYPTQKTTVGAYFENKSSNGFGVLFTAQWSVSNPYLLIPSQPDSNITATFKLYLQQTSLTYCLLDKKNTKISIGAGMAYTRNTYNLAIAKTKANTQVFSKSKLINNEINPVFTLAINQTYSNRLYIGANINQNLAPINNLQYRIKTGQHWQQLNYTPAGAQLNPLTIFIKLGYYVR